MVSPYTNHMITNCTISKFEAIFPYFFFTMQRFLKNEIP